MAVALTSQPTQYCLRCEKPMGLTGRRPSQQFCTLCRAICPDCGGGKRRDAARCSGCSALVRQRGGQGCLGGSGIQPGACGVDWGSLKHRHCDICANPCAWYVKICSACDGEAMGVRLPFAPAVEKATEYLGGHGFRDSSHGGHDGGWMLDAQWRPDSAERGRANSALTSKTRAANKRSADTTIPVD